MLGKATKARLIGKMIKPENSGYRNIYSDEIITSPKSPLDFKIKSPRGMKICDMGGVGLGILAALEKSSGGPAVGGCGGSGGGSEIPMKLIVGSLNLNMNLNRSSLPIPIGSSSSCNKSRTSETKKCREIVHFEEEEEEEEESESYTYVTCHNGPNKKSVTRVYCDHGVVEDENLYKNELFDHHSHQKYRLKNLSVFYESPPRFTESKLLFPTSDFLSSCYLCRKNLHGKDIYMYRGEKAFCSTECRQNQIVKDERKEKCRREASIYGDQYASISPYSNGGQQQQQLHFSPGITAS